MLPVPLRPRSPTCSPTRTLPSADQQLYKYGMSAVLTVAAVFAGTAYAWAVTYEVGRGAGRSLTVAWWVAYITALIVVPYGSTRLG